ncbi:MAG: translocation protein TolB, partial [Bacteroidota bacterium]
MFKGRFSLFICVFIAFSSLEAQHYSTAFGQNRIQYKNFEWLFYSTNNFDIYYYPGGQEYALEAIEYLEDEFLELTDQIGYKPYFKTKIFIYNSVQDLQQSNVGIDGDVFTIGGKTEFVKLNLEVAYPGKAVDFKQQLIYELSSTLINDMMYGGSLGQIFQNSYLLSLPSWFIDGAARYTAYGWSREMDDYLRDYMSRKKIKKLSRIDGEAAAIIGQSIWNYLAVTYGEGNISNILNLTRIIRKEENAIANTLGVSFKNFLEEWKVYYLTQREEVETNYSKVAKDKIIDKIRRAEDLITSSITFNKDGTRVAYATQKNGKYKLYAVNLETGKKSQVSSGGFQISDQKIDEQLPLLDWQDAFTLGAIIYRRGYLYLNTYDIETGQRREKPLTRFRQIESFSFNENGRLAVISGDIGGQNDLFLIAMNRNSIRRITRDIYDDLDPTFVPGTAAIVFSSNRQSDSINVNNDVELESLNKNFNLFIYDLDTTTSKFYRLTNMLSEDRKPYAKSRQEIYYLSDQRGISNLYLYSFLDSVSQQVTDYDKSILSYDLHFDPERITYTMLDRGEEKVFLDTTVNLRTSRFTVETPRRRREQAMLLINRRLEKLVDSLPPPPEPELDVFDTDDFIFEDEPEVSKFTEPDWIDTDNYVFEDEATTTFQTESFFSKYQSFAQENERIGPNDYKPIFSFNNVITSFLWDPYRQFMTRLETEINDIFENYKVKAGALVTTNFDQGDIFAEFQYLKYWMDLKLRVDKKYYQVQDRVDLSALQEYRLNRVRVTAAVPVTHTFRVEASPFFTNTSFTNLNFQSVTGQNLEFAENDREEYFGGTLALVFDNT